MMFKEFVKKYAIISFVINLTLFVFLYLINQNLEVEARLNNVIINLLWRLFYYSCFITPIVNILLISASFIKRISNEKLATNTIVQLLISLIYPFLGLYIYLSFGVAGII